MGFNFSYELVLSPAIRLHRVTSKNADYIFEELSSIQYTDCIFYENLY